MNNPTSDEFAVLAAAEENKAATWGSQPLNKWYCEASRLEMHDDRK